MGATSDGIRRRLITHAPELAGAALVIGLAHRSGATSVGLPALLVLLALAVLVSVTAYSVWGRDAGPLAVHARAAAQTGVFAVLLYAAGTGPALAVALLLPVTDTVRYSGSKAGPTVLAWASLAIALGQVTIALGWVDSVLPNDVAHGVAALGLLTMWLVGLRVVRLARDNELAHRRIVADEARVRALLASSNDVTIVISDGEIVYQSPSAERLLGYIPGSLHGRPYLDLVHPDDRAATIEFVRRLLDLPGQTDVVECRLRTADGRWLPVESSCRNLLDDPEIRGFVVNSRDLSDRKALERQLEHRTIHDPLTGLANRVLLLDRLDHAAARASRLGGNFAVLVVNVDGFKAVNDRLGPLIGDAVLRTLADRLNDVVRGVDTVARTGADEFAVLLDSGESALEAGRVATRILDVMAQPVDADGHRVEVTASVGIAHADEDPQAADVLRNADIAMHLAKERGRSRFEVFEVSMHERVMDRLDLEGDLASAVAAGDLEIHYQPIVRLADRRISGFEALLRWTHPERGPVAPNRFIPLAEQSGLIVPLGRHVLRQACRQLADWRAHEPAATHLTISVNVSMHQLHDNDLVADVREALAASGLPAGALTLELTESALVEDTDRTIDTLAALSGLGVRIAIDDFGTGYSSLAYLHRFPVDVLKIDRSFVTSVASGRQSPALAAAIVDLGRTLELSTVAEGIEHEAELQQFRALHCTHGQGFLFSRAVPASDVPALLVELLTVPGTATSTISL